MANDRGSGVSSTALSKKSGRPGLLSRTLRPFALAGWNESSATSMRSGMWVSGTVYPLSPLVPLTNATERGSSHDAPRDGKTGSSATAAGKHGALFVRNTLVSVRASLLNNGKLWPTPCASEHKFRIQGNSQQSKSLAGIARREALDLDPHSIGQLNPEFLEWLMGFPIGGTALDALATQLFLKWRKSSFVPSQPSTLTLADFL